MYDHLKINNVCFTLTIESINQELKDDPQAAIIRMLEKVITQLKENKEVSSIKDINGNYVGDWDFDVEGEEWPTESEAIESYKEMINEQGNFYDEWDLDPVKVEEDFSSFVDLRISDDEYPANANNWTIR